MTGRALLLVALALVASGCPRTPRLPQPTTPPEPTTVLAELDRRRAATGSLRARAKLRSGLAGVWAREALVVERPSSVRIDILSPFGLALALGTDGRRLWVFPVSEGIRYEGRASPENLARFLGAPVAIEDLVDILLGLPPKRDPTAPVAVAWEHAAWRLTVPHATGMQELLVHPRTAAVLEAVEWEDGAAGELRVRFHDHRGGFPHAIDISAPALSVDARLRYVDVEHNPTIDAAVFRGPVSVPARPLEVVGVVQ